ncbi:MAG TPA: PP2C family serine/threonine-protein phosphatase [Bryobacteraceae bacterium]|jgi:serine/threonine protein phosphatase PrpC|nr:PP2C family serine/threonine-protein phosphatase [Bryobacteraceae bacterium]
MQCPQCAADIPDDDIFCEACGVRVNTEADPAACSCGARSTEIDDDGFCTRCGKRVRRPASDRIEITLSPLCAAVCDRGKRHARNEDRAGALQVGNSYALVACDGVSASRESELASGAVVASVSESLSRALSEGQAHDAQALMRDAIAAAAALLAAQAPHEGDDNPPSTTVAAALVADGYATVGWVGDSRVYWINRDGARQLTSDHSWMNDVVSAGKMTAEEAGKAREAHAITRWLGADAGENAAPDTARIPVNEEGVLLLCTDGLWNYAPTPEEMTRLIHEANGEDGDALTTARNLVHFANEKGGQDNITAIVLRWKPPAEEDQVTE